MNVNTVKAVTDTVISGPTLTETGTGNEIKSTPQVQEAEVEKKQKEQSTPPAEELKELADTLNDYMDDLQTNLGFFINEELNNEVIVEIKNRKTDELVKQIPSEEMVAIREKMAELTGLLLDRSV